MKAHLVSLGSALLLAGSLTACSSKVPGQVAAIAERACACQTAECADKVEKEYLDFVAANAKVKGTREERDEAQGHYNRMRECIGRARSAGAPAAPPSATPAPAASGEAPAGQAPAAPAGGAPAGKAPAGSTAAPAAPAGQK